LDGTAMGNTSPLQFLRQVKQEVKKVTWPVKKDVMRATVMVLVIVAIASVFFFFVDMFFGAIVRSIFKY
jgi:preprotein translocase subunit SecE